MMMEMSMPNDPFTQFVSYMLGYLSPPRARANRRYIDGRLARSEDTTQMEILEVVRSCGQVCSQDVVKLSGYPKTTVYKMLEEMLRLGLIKAEMRKDLTTNGRGIKHYMVNK